MRNVFWYQSPVALAGPVLFPIPTSFELPVDLTRRIRHHRLGTITAYYGILRYYGSPRKVPQ